MLDLDKILPLVQRPSRYINHEINSYKPDMENDVSICLCFPDIYEIGASNLGLEILYHLVNEKKVARCERAYAPDTDLEQILRQEKISLFSLESKSPLKEFDIVGFSLQCELVGTNIVNMLSLSDISVFAKDRKEDEPLIIGGGPVMANPEPFADFFDLFTIGDGEVSMVKILETYRTCKKNKLSRKETLFELSKIEGIYIPAFYDVSYNEDNTVKSVKPNIEGVPETIKKTTVDLDKVFFHNNKIVPFVETVHNRLNIEVARGCVGRCRFCQASKYYRPWRARKVETILNLLDESLKNTGYEEVSFSSLSCTDYKDLEELLLQTNEKYYKQNLNVTLPSMRCNKFSLKVAEYLNRDKKPSITFAPEAGSDRLRNVIGKYLSENEIVDTLNFAYQMGWRAIKLYFMIGLPTETPEDISAIKTLIDKVRKTANRLNFSITVSPFVPKAQTAFQWEPMFSSEYFRDVITNIKKSVPADIRAHNHQSSIIEAFLARADRRVSKAIYIAWQKGMRFDQWKDKFNFEVWTESIKEAGFDLNFYVYRRRDFDEVLPWQHINLGVDKQFLYNDYTNGIKETANVVSGKEKQVTKLPENISSVKKEIFETKFRVLLKFSRTGFVKYVSQLEQIDFFRRALKRTKLPLAYTNGFSPQVKAAFGPAIAVGYESDSEYVDLSLTEKVDLVQIKQEISKILPEGYQLLDAKYIPLRFPSIESVVNLAEYTVKGVKLEQNYLNEYLNQKEILIKKIKKDKETIVDVKDLIREIQIVDDNTLKIFLRFGPAKNMKLEKILQNLLKIQEKDIKILYTKRDKLFVESKGIVYEI
ncbi:TIGR03960 family B12-binding radical SAM protein [Candidatus Ruminimicrobiellum ovillum]|uniref:TIGR03960 family B12-binding radical SAM protein n=1 Tax=Candidatus Ruminimicrobiellum ovillum TaxID=1947927 RepID=UPI0035597CF7